MTTQIFSVNPARRRGWRISVPRDEDAPPTGSHPGTDKYRGNPTSREVLDMSEIAIRNTRRDR